ncbi:hypothetical protein D3C83_61640 [compost metagenome]
MPGELFERLVRFLGMNDLHQFDLIELMLADHAAGVLAVGPRFAPEARRMTYKLQWQPASGNDLVANDVGDRHFCSRD